MLKLANTFSPLELCERGEYRLAAEMAGLRVGEWPENGSGGILAHAERLLVAGGIASTLAGIQQSGDRDVSKAMLLESVRLFGSDPRRHVAQSWLAWAHYWSGEFKDALTLAGNVLAERIDPATRFRVLLLRVSIYTDQKETDKAIANLAAMAEIYEVCDPLLKGKFHCHRGRILRLTNDTDGAIVDYDSAIYFFKEARSVRCQAIAANNLAGVYLETDHFPEAHRYAEQARELFEQLGDKTYLAQAWDQTALICLAEGKLNEAQLAVNSGIALVKYGKILNELRETDDKIKNKVALRSTDDHATLCTAPFTLNSTSPRESIAMTHLDSASLLIDGDPEKAIALLDLLIWTSTATDDPGHEAELDTLERMVFSRVPECEDHREEYRRKRLFRPVPTSVDS